MNPPMRPLISSPRSLRLAVLATVTTGLLGACAGGTKQPAANPEDSAAASAAPADPNAPRPRTVLSTRGAEPLKGKRMKAKKPPRKPGWKTVSVGALPEFTVSEVYPTVAAPGSVVRIRGGGFGKGAKVSSGGVQWEVTSASTGEILTKVPQGAKAGPVEVKMGSRTAKSDVSFLPLASDDTFGRPVTGLDRGFRANVYIIGKAVQELPAFNDLGDPVGALHLSSLDVPTGSFAGFEYRGSKVATWVGLHLQGGLNVTEGGEYELCVESDDGAQLYLEQNLLVDNDGVHEAKKVCEIVYLEPGEYATDLLYFQGEGPVTLRVTWAKDGAAATPVPSDALIPPGA